jgi:hypothetical protein
MRFHAHHVSEVRTGCCQNIFEGVRECTAETAPSQKPNRNARLDLTVSYRVSWSLKQLHCTADDNHRTTHIFDGGLIIVRAITADEIEIPIT